MTRRILLALTLAAAAAPAAAQDVPEHPFLLQGNESAAHAEGALGTVFNPATIGLRYPAELAVVWADHGLERSPEGGLLSLKGLGLAYRRVPDAWSAFSLGLASGGERFRSGTAVTWLRDERAGDRVADWRSGLLARPAPWLSLGAVADHVGQPTLAGRRLDREYTVALGLRPLALAREAAHTWGTRLTLTADVLMLEEGRREEARVRVGAEFEPVPGLVLRGAVEDHGGFHVGLGLLGPRARVAAHSSRRDDERRYESYVASVHAGEDLTVLAGPRERRVAVVRAGGDLGDEAMGGFSLLGAGSSTPVKPLHEQLARALEDPLTRGVLLDLRGISNLAQIEELRPRIERLRRAGKPVVAFLENGGGRGDLYLAGACDRVVASEEAFFGALGLRVERRYYRELLEDWGVRVDRTSHGRFKSAFRNFSVDSTPPADREVIERNLDVQQELFVSTLANDRRIPRERLLPALDGRFWRASDLAQAGVVDSVGYREDALRQLGRLCGLGDKPRTVNLRRVEPAAREWMVPTRIAVVYAAGAIETGRSGNNILMGASMGSETVVQQVERAFRNRDVEAVVLRVESPGGSALASDLIHHATRRMKRETRKPLIVSMGGVAASGGYYISAAADRIYADRFTRTGSIGVLSIKPSLEGWYRGHEVRQDAFQRGRWMAGWSLGRDWTPEMQASADSATFRHYQAFVAKVAEGRRMSWAGVDSVAQGRVWMGEDARARGLVDEIGGLEQALAEARRRGGVPAGEKIRPLEYRRPRPGFIERAVGLAVSRAWERNARLPEPGEALFWDDEAR